MEIDAEIKTRGIEGVTSYKLRYRGTHWGSGETENTWKYYGGTGRNDKENNGTKARENNEEKNEAHQMETQRGQRTCRKSLKGNRKGIREEREDKKRTLWKKEEDGGEEYEIIRKKRKY